MPGFTLLTLIRILFDVELSAVALLASLTLSFQIINSNRISSKLTTLGLRVTVDDTLCESIKTDFTKNQIVQ